MHQASHEYSLFGVMFWRNVILNPRIERKSRYKSILGVSTTALFPTTTHANTNIVEFAKNKVCRLAIDDIHFSSTLIKYTGKPYIKIRAKTEFYLYQSSVQILLKIYQVYANHGDKLLRSFDNYRGVNSGYLIEIKDAQLLCVNKDPNKYYGIATAHVVIPGRGVFDKSAFSPISPTFPCGIR